MEESTLRRTAAGVPGAVEHRNVRAAVDDIVEMVDIARIKVDPRLRLNRYDDDHMQRLSEVEVELPPVIIDRKSGALVDGLHRLAAARAQGKRQIRARFFDGSPAEAYLLWLELNAHNGLPLTLSERKAAAVVLLQYYPWWSDRAIARASGLSGKTVGSLRSRSTAEIPRSNTRVGLDGRARKLDNTDGRELVATLCREHPKMSLRELSRRSGLSVGTVRTVRAGALASADPSSGSRSGNAGSAGAGALREPESLTEQLNRLRRDPAMAYTDSGRRTIRWLDAVMSRQVQMSLVREIPPHCTRTVADIIGSCADDLREFAEALNHRLHATLTPSLSGQLDDAPER